MVAVIGVKLSKRLQQVAELVPDGAVLADIGSDHAYLPVYLVQQGRVRRAVAGEINPGPLAAARRTVEEAGLGRQIEVRQGDGLAVLQPGEASVVTICGMGGATIADILEAGGDKLAGVQYLVLQPMTDSDRLRRWLHDHQWRIAAETLVDDDGILYEILQAQPGCERYPDPLWYEIGSVELLQHHPLFPQRIEGELANIDRVLLSLQKAQTSGALQKKAALSHKKKRLEEVLQACKRPSRM